MTAKPPPRRIVVVGAGYTGASLAVQLVRASPHALAITLVDPAEQPGRGLAYTSNDPDHRLNVPSFAQTLLPDDITHFSRWALAQGLLAQDPEALAADGGVYLRRGDFGRYVEDTLAQHAHWPATGSTIGHCRDQAVALEALQPVPTPGPTLPPANLPPGAPTEAVRTASGQRLPADLVCIATGNPLPRLQPPFDPALAGHPAVLAHPLGTPERLTRIAPDARVLLVGSGLTALDILCSLLRQGHRGPVTVASRRGLQPRPQGPWPAALVQLMAEQPGLAGVSALPGAMMLARIQAPPPDFLTQADLPAQVRPWLRALRQRASALQAQGGSWYEPFDQLRDTVGQLWPRLPAAEQRRFLRCLRPWYDVHRFRAAPQALAMVAPAVARGQVTQLAARLLAVQDMPAAQGDAPAQGKGLQVTWRRRGHTQTESSVFDQVINCTGLDAGAAVAANPLLASAVAQGRLQADACGLGLAVDGQCRAMDAQGQPQPRLRVLGPPTLGSAGDTVGALYIAAQIHRVLPELLRQLQPPA